MDNGKFLVDSGGDKLTQIQELPTMAGNYAAIDKHKKRIMQFISAVKRVCVTLNYMASILELLKYVRVRRICKV